MRFCLMLLFNFHEGIFPYNDNQKRKRNFYGQTTYIVKVLFFDVSASINSYLAFNLKEKKTNLIVRVYNLNKYLLFKQKKYNFQICNYQHSKYIRRGRNLTWDIIKMIISIFKGKEKLFTFSILHFSFLFIFIFPFLYCYYFFLLLC